MNQQVFARVRVLIPEYIQQLSEYYSTGIPGTTRAHIRATRPIIPVPDKFKKLPDYIYLLYASISLHRRPLLTSFLGPRIYFGNFSADNL